MVNPGDIALTDRNAYGLIFRQECSRMTTVRLSMQTQTIPYVLTTSAHSISGLYSDYNTATTVTTS